MPKALAAGLAAAIASPALAQTVTWSAPDGGSPGYALAALGAASDERFLPDLAGAANYTGIVLASIPGSNASARNQLNLNTDSAGFEWNAQIPDAASAASAGLGWTIRFTVDQNALFTFAGNYQVLVDGEVAQPDVGEAFTFTFFLTRLGTDEVLTYDLSTTPAGDILDVIAGPSGTLLAGAEYELNVSIAVQQDAFAFGALETFGVLAFGIVPAPGSAGLFAAAGLLAARRRR